MSNETLNILYIADIIGDPGLNITEKYIHDLKRKYAIHLIIANGENGTAGKGLTLRVAKEFFDLGIDVITSGNHIWNKTKLLSNLDQAYPILRPLNYPPGCPGRGSIVIQIEENLHVAIINLQGRSFMYPIDCPFRSVDNEIDKLKNQNIHNIIIDFHAEATAEKWAMAWYIDGRVSALIGSHTHVQTADEQVLPNGTAYITDAGMTGPFDSVIGMDKETAIHRFKSQMPVYYKIAKNGLKISGVYFSVDPRTGKALSINRFQLPD